MRALLDEMMSRKLARELTGHEVSTVQREGWSGLTNGTLLDAIDAHFDVFITMDRGMRHQQQLTGRPFGIVEVRARSNAIRALLPVVPRIRAAVDAIQPGEVVTIDTTETVADSGDHVASPESPTDTSLDG